MIREKEMRALGNARFPRRWRFPGGFTVEIHVADRLPKGRLARPRKIELEWDDEGNYETYENNRAVITLWSGLTPRQRWRTLMHELQHALVDAQNLVDIKLGIR